jgi:hypothetical protein
MLEDDDSPRSGRLHDLQELQDSHPTVNAMDRVILDSSIRVRLGNLQSRLEFCDESGEVLGYFVPASERQPLLSAWARGEFTDEEIERARREPGGFSLAEVLAGLHE